LIASVENSDIVTGSVCTSIGGTAGSVTRIIADLQNWLEQKLPELRRNTLFALGISVAIFLAALAARLALRMLVPTGLPFVTFLAAVPLATVGGGLLGGLLALALSSAAAWLWFPPAPPNNPIVAIAVFVLVGGILILLMHLLNKTVERLAHERSRAEGYLHSAALAEQQLEQLNGELRHRNKNLYAVINTLVTQSARHARSVNDLANSLTGRLMAMASAQDVVLSSDSETANLLELSNDVLASIKPPGDRRLKISGPNVRLNKELATPIGLVLHELATNCLKYGAWSNGNGQVLLSWTTHTTDDPDQLLNVRWEERDGPAVVAPEHTGMGSLLIDRGVPGAKVSRTFGADGLICLLELQIPEISPTISLRRRRAAG
jgi:two-component sensor histidine kinase